MKKIVVSNRSKRNVNKSLAALSAGFLPIASYVIAHIEAKEEPLLFILVAAALAYSAPTLAKWAQGWAGHKVKAYAFTVLLEGVMVFSHLLALSLTGLLILVSINAVTAWKKAK